MVKRDAIEQDLHVLNTVDGDARLADIADDARMVTVITAVRGKIEGHGQPLLPRREVAPVEGVRFLSGRKARILPDRPRATSIHGGAHAACERRKARQARISSYIVRCVKRLHGNTFRRLPGEILTLHFLGRCGLPVFDLCHFTSILSSPACGRGPRLDERSEF